MIDNDVPSGVIPRMTLVLETINRAGVPGARLIDLAHSTGIARPTVHRLLKDLTASGYVQQTPTKTYVLGQQLYWLGLTAHPPLKHLGTIRGIIQQLALETGDTVYLAIRQQAGVRYVLRAEGDFPIRSHAVSVGDLKSFSSTYSGFSLLASLPDEEVDSALAALLEKRDATKPISGELESQLRHAIANVRSQGWCHMTGIVMPGIAGISAPVPNSNGIPMAAVSLSTVESRLSPERAERLAPDLLTTARRVAEHL